MRAEIYNRLISLGFEPDEAAVISEEFAGALSGLGVAAFKGLTWVGKTILFGLVEAGAAAILL